jgi:Sigma-70, region 4
MPRLDDLPPDLRATLSLLVDRGKSYAQVAELLGIPESAVRDRAHAALDTLAGGPGESAFSPVSAAAASPSASSASRPASATSSPVDSPPAAPRTSGPSSPGLPVSRRGGALLLAGIAVVVVVVVVLLTSGGGSHATGTGAGASASTSTSASTTSTSSSSKGTKPGSAKPTVTNQLTLTASEPSSKAIGIVEVLAEGSQRAFYLATEHLPPPPPGTSYVIWLYNSPTSAEALSRAACPAGAHIPSCPTVGANGRLQGGALLPSNAGDYSHILLTRETSEHPTTPGPAVLSGAFSLGG